ncbi:hypothetical protein GQS52_19020 [Streptomyces sp. SCUT-3]|uniref:AfsR/SARP family transcriptional regulator n=1 Tax=Streptomyces thermolineatus TaxID=44033 RepID=UPI000CB0816C|nr:hypothetical protein C0036_01375 [Streptomyces sp. DJ]QMV23518.1 hypothetical protein GQS52_19020 [Streptomyces sp. SCUT-3]
MDVAVLGPLTVRYSGLSVVPTAAKPRRLLGLLAVRAGQPVPVETICAELWGGDRPRTAHLTLQGYVSSLRARVRAAAEQGSGGEEPVDPKEIIVGTSCGYVLRAGESSSDVREFDRLAEAGHEAQKSGNHRLAAQRFGRALALWRGPALADVRSGPELHREALRLEESRLSVLGCRVEADLNMGRHHALVGEIAALCAQYPLHEGLHRQHMITLCRVGRRLDALRAYNRLRAALKAAQGIEPSIELKRLHHQVLHSRIAPFAGAVEPMPALSATSGGGEATVA